MGLFDISRDPAKELSKKIDDFQKGLPKSKNLMKDFEKLEKILNTFLEKDFGVHYKFTYEDLKFDIKEKNPTGDVMKLVERICDEMNELEFDKSKITIERLLQLSTDIEKLSVNIVPMAASPKANIKDSMPAPVLMDNPVADIEMTDSMFAPNVPIEPATLAPQAEVAIPAIPEMPPIDSLPPAPKETQKETIIEKIVQHIIPHKEDKKDDLPMFERSKKDELSDLVKSLERNKRGIAEEIKLIQNEQALLKKEKGVSKDLPQFKIFHRKLDDEIAELEDKKQALFKKEHEIEKKIGQLEVFEKDLEERSSKVSEIEKGVEEKRSYVNAKEKVITEIKKDLESTYQLAMEEIERIRTDLKEKEENFVELQQFFNKRESRLHHEEANLIDEKRKHGKLVTSLLEHHRFIAEKDLKELDARISDYKVQETRLDSEIEEMSKRFTLLTKEKNLLKGEARSKERYFKRAEEEFKSKDSTFDSIQKSIEKKEKILLEKEKKIIALEKSLEEGETAYRENHRKSEERDLDLQVIEKEIDRLHFSMKNNVVRLKMREQQIDKRISSFEIIRQDVRRTINRERGAVRRIERRLEKKGIKVNRGLRETEKLQKFNDTNFTSIYDKAHLLNAGEELHIKETQYLSGSGENLGNPDLLDVLRLLNIAKNSLKEGDAAKPKEIYQEVQRLFENLDEYDREEVYPIITRVFKARLQQPEEKLQVEQIEDHPVLEANIDSLIQRFEDMVDVGDTESSGQIYSRIQNMYVGLPKEEKSKYYNKIMELYGRLRPVAASL
jgi:hypothetical protein